MQQTKLNPPMLHPPSTCTLQARDAAVAELNAQLTSHISSSLSVTDLCGIVASHGPSLNYINVSLLCEKLGQLQPVWAARVATSQPLDSHAHEPHEPGSREASRADGSSSSGGSNGGSSSGSSDVAARRLSGSQASTSAPTAAAQSKHVARSRGSIQPHDQLVGAGPVAGEGTTGKTKGSGTRQHQAHPATAAINTAAAPSVTTAAATPTTAVTPAELPAVLAALLQRHASWCQAAHLSQAAAGLAAAGYWEAGFWAWVEGAVERKLMSFTISQLTDVMLAVGGCSM